jgi:hypothetical protein
LGEDTRGVLVEAGYSATEIQAMLESGAVKAAEGL